MKSTVKKSYFRRKRPTVIDLFSGAGGTGLGFIKAKFKVLAAVEIDESAAETYERNLGVKVKREDITKFSPKSFRKELKIKRRQLDVLVGCPPCQGFSRMRNNDGIDDTRNCLVLRYLEFVKEFMPRFAVFENVPGLLRTKHGQSFYNELKLGLEKLGYNVQERIENAADYGTPQHRRRVIVIAGRFGETPLFPVKTHGNPKSFEVKQKLLRPWLTVSDVLKKYPKLNAGENGEINGKYPNHVAPRMGKKVLNFMSQVPNDGGSRLSVPKEFWLNCHKDHDGHIDVYGRISWNQPSNTITCGCTNVSKGRFAHPDQNRAITFREAAALQGFGDEIIFYGKQLSHQIGNAVPPPLAEAIAETLKKQIYKNKPLPKKRSVKN